jgi:UDP-GlcNAc:undecaprenyl-phosphate GlcNAc-1-phosphate transferase
VHDEKLLRIAAQAFMVSLTCALVVMPGCIKLARMLGVVDKPGGRKRHEKVTSLLGGLGVVVASAVGYLVLRYLMRTEMNGEDLDFPAIGHVIAGSLVLFAIGLVDDVFKDSMGFEPKLLGQIIGVGILMWPGLQNLWAHPDAGLAAWMYQLFFLCWYLTIVNSFNFSDNMNGLMSGLSIIALSAAILYLQDSSSHRTQMVAVLLVGALLGFLPYNFPRSRIFLGDAGSMFIGFWMAWIQFDLVEGFMGMRTGDMGANHLVPAVLIMGIPLFDAAFVVLMRVVDKRPVYLGDDQHLSHRLVRGGFTAVETVIILWGLGCILAWLGILASQAEGEFRYLIIGASFLFMVAVTRKIMALERVHTAYLERTGKALRNDEDEGDS